MRPILFFLLCTLASCFLLKDYRRETFTYGTQGQAEVIIPKGWTKQEAYTDSAGGAVQVYRYANGSVLYFIHGLARNGLPIIHDSLNLARPHLQGGIFYKGQDTALRFWREVQVGNFRLGYHSVPSHNEVLFDSALNFVRVDTARVSGK